MKRIAEIEKRLADIMKELRGENADLNALEKEVKELKEERTQLFAAEEQRNRVIAGITAGAGEVIGAGDPEQRGAQFDPETVLGTPEYRNAFAKTLMRRQLSDVEKRALGTALTTTSDTYTAATSSADGVNNGGLFIPSDINLALLNEISLVSPIFRDVAKSSFKGLMKFPYCKSKTGAATQTEGTATADEQMEFAEITLTNNEIAATIRVTWKLEKTAVAEFLNYLQREIVEMIQDKTVQQVIYGAGTTGQLTGATINAINTTYTAAQGVMNGIETALKSLTAKLKVGAKIYVAADIAETITFAQDSNGNYVFTPFNSVGLKSIATYPVEVDPYLNAGDFIIGNLSRVYRFNTDEPVSIARDVSGKQRITDYTAYSIIGGAPKPSSLAYGKKTTE